MIKVTIVTTSNKTNETAKTDMTFADFEEAFNYSQKMLSSCKYLNETGVAYFEEVE